MRSVGRSPRPAWIIALLACLAIFLAYTHATKYPYHRSMDLYVPWGIPIALEALGPGSNPYADTEAYALYLDEVVRGVDRGSKLHDAHDFWNLFRTRLGIEPNGTPFFYALLAMLPGDFDRLHLLQTLAALLIGGTAVFLLARLRGVSPLTSLCIAVFALATFNPIFVSIETGNVSIMQLIVPVAMIAISQLGLWDRYRAIDRLYLAILAVFFVFKPNTLYIVGALALHYAAARGARRFAAGAAWAAVMTALAMACGAWYFGSAGVWLDWLDYVQGKNGGTLVYRTVLGNLSLPNLFSERVRHYGAGGYSVLLSACFMVMILACATGMGRQPQQAPAVLRRWLADPWLMASVGVVFMWVVSPLVWHHYHGFSLIPIAWLLRAERPRDPATICAIVACLLFSRMLMAPAEIFKLLLVEKVLLFWPWIPLLPGVFLRLAYDARAGSPAGRGMRTALG